MGNQNRKATELTPVFGCHGAYGGHRAPRDHTISFRLRDDAGQFRSNVVWLMPDQLAQLTAANIRWLVERSNGKRR
jgi:hypothetical protein